MKSRATAVREVSEAIIRVPHDHPLRVAVDGRSASGKTTLARELAADLEGLGQTVIRASLDGFHRPRAERYARGRKSAEGYYYDARDLGAIRRLLLDPLGPSGDRMYRTASWDLERDQPVEQAPVLAPSNSFLIVDGTFLQRPELADAWDLKIYVKVSDETATLRGLARDSEAMGGREAAVELYNLRYRPADELYRRECDPEGGADIVFDNEDFEAPTVFIRPLGGW